MALAECGPVIEYLELKSLVSRHGLFEPQPLYYAFKILTTLGMLALSLSCLVMFGHSWLQLLNAVFLAFVCAQIGLIGHDIGHWQVFRRTRSFELASFVTANLLQGVSWTWWIDRHNRHHAHPNQLDVDPDIGVPVLAFTEKEARSRQGLLRFMVSHQHYLYLPLELAGWFSFFVFSIRTLLQKKAKYPRAEALVMGVHLVLYFALLFSCLSAGQVVVFFLVHRMLFGLYLGSISAPNHKGMLIVEKGDAQDFLRQQVLSSRNVQAHPITDFWYGGLNYQIEHHLFPTIPRKRLKEVQPIVKRFCEQRAIPYHETSVLQSYREIFQYLQRASAPLRTAD
jgi:fatty acid desaturase